MPAFPLPSNTKFIASIVTVSHFDFFIEHRSASSASAMRCRVIYAALAVVLCAAGGAQAQHRYDLAGCIAAARAFSPELRISGLDVRGAELLRDELRTTALPQFRLDGLALYAPHNGSFGYDHALSNGGQLAGRVSLLQSLYDGGARQIRTDQLGLEMQRHEIERRAADYDIVLSVTLAYIDALHAAAQVRLQQESVDELAQYLELVVSMNAAGAASQADVAKTRVDLDAEAIALSRAHDLDTLARMTLAQKMGFVDAPAIDIEGTLEELPLAIDIDTLHAVLDTSFSNIDVKIAELDVAAGRADIALGATERKPIVIANADAGLWTSLDNLSVSPGDRTSMLGFSVGVGVGMPIATWGTFDLRAEQREVNVQTRRERMRLISHALSGGERSLLLQIRSARSRRDALRKTFAAAQDNITLMRSRFRAAAATSLDVLTAHQTFLHLRSDAVDADAELHQLSAQLARIAAQQ